jgi:hypothetical protein
MFNLSSAEGTRFAEIVAGMNDRIRRLGPNPLHRNAAVPVEHSIGQVLEEAANVIPGEIS